MPKNMYVVERSITVNAAPPEVFERIVDFRRWTTWSPWEGMDPDMKRDYSGATSGTGAVYRWSGNRKAGKGQMRITEAAEPHRVAIDLSFEKPFKSQSETVFTVNPDGAGSRVNWSMTGKKNVMMTVMGIFMPMDKMIGPDFERGLANLKADVETTR